MKQITSTVSAWLSQNDVTMRDLREMKPDHAISTISFISADMTSCGWIKVGTAEITITFDDENDINAIQVAALREVKKALMAKAEAEINRIEWRIQNLLCLEAPTDDEDDQDGLPAHKQAGYAERMYENADMRRKEARENAL